MVGSAVHDIHTARWLLAEEVREGHPRWIPSDPASPDSCRLVVIQMTLANGSLALIEVNAESGYGYEVDVEVTGEQGRVHFTPLSTPWVRRARSQARGIDADWLTRFEAAYVDEARSWIDSLLAGAPTGPSAWDGYTSLVIAEACLESAHSGAPQPISAGTDRPALYDR